MLSERKSQVKAGRRLKDEQEQPTHDSGRKAKKDEHTASDHTTPQKQEELLFFVVRCGAHTYGQLVRKRKNTKIKKSKYKKKSKTFSFLERSKGFPPCLTQLHFWILIVRKSPDHHDSQHTWLAFCLLVYVWFAHAKQQNTERKKEASKEARSGGQPR